jgi:uncharacterized protein YjbI with pentapeptide repeats
VGALVAVGAAATVTSPTGSVWRDLALSVLSGGIVGGALVLVEGLLSEAAAQRAEVAALLAQLSITENLSGIDLRGRDLSDLYLPGRSLVAGQLEGIRLDRAKLYYGNFRHALLRAASLRGADLSGSTLAHADLTGTDLTGAVLRDVDLSHANLTGANLTGVDLAGARIQSATLVGARLDGATLANCYLQGSDLTGASLTATILTGNEYDAMTSWPAEFVPPPSSAVTQAPIAEMKLDRYLAWRAGGS